MSRLQSDSIWVVVLEKLRQGLGCAGSILLPGPVSMAGSRLRCISSRLPSHGSGSAVLCSTPGLPSLDFWAPRMLWACRDGMMEQLERFLLVASGDELTGERTAEGAAT